MKHRKKKKSLVGWTSRRWLKDHFKFGRKSHKSVAIMDISRCKMYEDDKKVKVIVEEL